ncbi:MAG TPA: SGNH/GDSL hydrolase family protein [Polyangiaceae bacterium]|nr:SGNH/GDSL hydrolase family protein [Polyangiaceae bacterium]
MGALAGKFVMLWAQIVSFSLVGCSGDSSRARIGVDGGPAKSDAGLAAGGRASNGGGASSSGGASSDGALLDASTGIAASGAAGTSHGGSGNAAGRTSRGGSGNSGGVTNGGASSGGATNGGATNGGATNGGAANGGAANGGATNGGATNGGATNGGAANGGVANGGVGGAAAQVRVVGRTDGDPKAPRFEWSGVSIEARFKGTSVQADMDGGNDNYFEVIVDGQTQPKVATTSGRRKVPIVSGLSDGEHDVVIWRRTEANNAAPTQFFGLDLGGGTLLPVTPPAHKLEVIGDSITCGYGDEGVGPSCSFSYDTENDYLAYGSVAARALGADLFTECWSGKGMYRNIGGDMTETMPALFQRTIPTDSTSTWNFSWIPDAVVIDLGTNDFAKGDPGQPYVNAYEAFVSNLRTRYPNAYVFLVIGPMTSGTSLTTARGYLDQVVKARSDAGDKRVKQILVDPQDQSKNGIGCDYHPSVATHDAMGKAIAAAIKTTMGW